MNPQERAEAAQRLLVEHMAPVEVVRALDADTCPYCLAYASLPCSFHDTRRNRR